MKWMLVAAGLLAATAFVPSQAEAGCVSGAVVGGVIGHLAGHHGMAGAAAGCAIGHHRRVMRDRDYGYNRYDRRY
ncbi:MAG: hypothetical protein JO001_15790 [Alphaproteobacteria bacterium]|nr:hypothetical protein [Alphaproteobacteria bacterium]